MKWTNPNFKTWEEQNAWEVYIIEKFNNLLNPFGWHFKQSTEFENINRHTDAFLIDCNGDNFRMDLKTVKWNSNSDKGCNSNFVVNITNFPIKCKNPIQCFCFVGENAEYAYFVAADKIFKDEIISVIRNNEYGEYEYFSYHKSKREDGSGYILFYNEYIKNNSFYVI